MTFQYFKDVTTFEELKRHKAFARFEELKKLYPNIETVKDIDKKFWEK